MLILWVGDDGCWLFLYIEFLGGLILGVLTDFVKTVLPIDFYRLLHRHFSIAQESELQYLWATYLQTMHYGNIV